MKKLLWKAFGRRLKVWYWHPEKEISGRYCPYKTRWLVGSGNCIECPYFNGFRGAGSKISCLGERG